MHPWDAGQLAAFLGWAEGASQNYPLWHTLAMTGMRRGEALALRWRDVDLETATLSVRRSAASSSTTGEDPQMRSWRATLRQPSRGPSTWTPPPSPCCAPGSASAAAMATAARASTDALAFGDNEGPSRDPEPVSR